MGIEHDLRIHRHVPVTPDARCNALFRETPIETVRRWALGTAWLLKPQRLAGLPALTYRGLAHIAASEHRLPDPKNAARRPDGLCGFVRDLSVPTLIKAHREGLYPFTHFGPAAWWSPAERCVLRFENFHLSRRLRSRLRQERHRVTFDRDFEGVIKACAEPRDGKWNLTWITPRIMRAYTELHHAGYAHSYEVWNAEGELVGGGYGVAVGGAFTIESQFARESHASKIGFAVLNWHLARWGFLLNDNKGPTHNCLEMGFGMIPRGQFLWALKQAALLPEKTGRWETEADLATVAAWQPAETPVPSVVPAVWPTEEELAANAAPKRHRTMLPFLPVLDQATIELGEVLLVIV